MRQVQGQSLGPSRFFPSTDLILWQALLLITKWLPGSTSHASYSLAAPAETDSFPRSSNSVPQTKSHWLLLKNIIHALASVAKGFTVGRATKPEVSEVPGV